MFIRQNLVKKLLLNLPGRWCAGNVILSKRTFLNFKNNKEYHGRKLVGFSSEQMFDVIADVRSYQNFLPFCKKSKILVQHSDRIESLLEIGFPPIYEKYVSRAELIRPKYVKVECVDGRLLKYLVSTWKFTPGLKSNPNSCIVDFYINFEFKSGLYTNIVTLIFDTLINQMESAFLREAGRRYGKPSIPVQILHPRDS